MASLYDLLSGQEQGRNPLHEMLTQPTGELTAYQPSLRDRIAYALSDAAGYAGAGRYAQQDIADKARNVIDFVPGLGELLGADDVATSLDAGNYRNAAINLGATALGAVPVVGDMAGRAIKGGAANYLRDLGKEAPDLYREMNAERALNFFHPGGLNNPWGQTEMYWSDVPELARGQHGNTGIRFKMSGDGVMGKSDSTSKPGLSFVASTSGGREYVSKGGVDFSKVKEVTIDPSVMFGGSPDDRLFMRHMNDLVAKGLFVADSPDGFVKTYRRVQKKD